MSNAAMTSLSAKRYIIVEKTVYICQINFPRRKNHWCISPCNWGTFYNATTSDFLQDAYRDIGWKGEGTEDDRSHYRNDQYMKRNTSLILTFDKKSSFIYCTSSRSDVLNQLWQLYSSVQVLVTTPPHTSLMLSWIDALQALEAVTKDSALPVTE